MKWFPGRSPKVHPPEMNAEATRLANLAGMQASGQPWQGDSASSSTADLLAVPHPDLVEAATPSETLRATELQGAVSVVGLTPNTAENATEGVETDESEPVDTPGTVKALKEALDELGIEYPTKANKADLEALYSLATPAVVEQ